ncbi:hypothetical protein CAEBREN_25176 [Caenorhabditis brenneri]|uniref:Sdz-33 F-box domain-containing protein n=1 Tax=Caenorhabditis brenneri TaxID=135651 RepID=G0MGD4_CAEBE|nr:hypothetical protein CAEBREN_25176 [Caenorhabditis brenneri]
MLSVKQRDCTKNRKTEYKNTFLERPSWPLSLPFFFLIDFYIIFFQFSAAIFQIMLTFPLFRLPLVSLAVVVKHFHLNHLINISFCSQKSRRLVKALRKKHSKICIQFLFSRKHCLYLNDRFPKDILPGEDLDKIQYTIISIKRKSDSLDTRHLKVGDSLVPVSSRANKHGEIDLHFHFDDVFDGSKTMSIYICSFLENPIYGLNLSSDFQPDQIRRTIDWAVSFQKSVESYYIEDDKISDDHFRNVLDVCSSANKFAFYGKLSPEFRHQFTFENDSITLTNAFWVNLDNLLKINCRKCTVWGSNLTNLEVNQYLKHWKTGKFPKLKVAYFEMEDINLEVLLADLSAVEFPEGEERTFKDASNRDVTINYGFDIQMENGTLATIVHQGGNIVSKWFYMVVW